MIPFSLSMAFVLMRPVFLRVVFSLVLVTLLLLLMPLVPPVMFLAARELVQVARDLENAERIQCGEDRVVVREWGLRLRNKMWESSGNVGGSASGVVDDGMASTG